jgi:extracellular factor (EF) 3-hydroxypalmitic acid methyl ester biosynthesis protein
MPNKMITLEQVPAPFSQALLIHAEFITALAARGGPTTAEYPAFDEWLREAQRDVDAGKVSVEQIHSIWRTLGEDYLLETVQGHTLSKPRGYLGDFITIDRMYTSSVSSNPRLASWDHCVHAQPGVAAMRKRKGYLLKQLQRLEVEDSASELHILNLASGPGRDMYEYLQMNPSSKIYFHCVDQDLEAISHARSLCSDFLHRVEFHHTNAFRFKTERIFDMAWSAGLFDYLNDGLFRRLLTRMLRLVRPGGQIVIANFSDYNPSRSYMELVGGWYLIYRSMQQLVKLALDSGIAEENISVRSDPEGIIHFLHIRKPGE